MGNVTTVGLDLAKNVFQVHGVDAEGTAVVRQRLTRGRMLKFFAKLPPCLVGIEAYASSHFWARELVALGHDVKLMPAQYVKPYVKRGKNDAGDAEAICEAVMRPTMRFVGIKTPEQQSAMMLHRVRLILNRQRTHLSNLTESQRRDAGGFACRPKVMVAGSHRRTRAMDDRASDEQASFDAYLEALVGAIGHAGRAEPLRDCCMGLMMPVSRKSVEPLAAVTAPARVSAQHRSLLHVAGQAPWSDEALMARVRDWVLPRRVERGGPITAWIIDDTGFFEEG